MVPALQLIVLVAPVLNAESAIFWTSGPVRPGETVLLTGSFPRSDTISVKVHLIDREGDWQAAVSSLGTVLKPVTATEKTVAFVLPSGPEGVYAFRLDETGESPLYGRVNLPDVWWTLAESPVAAPAIAADIELDAATPGAKVRLFGRCLASRDQVPKVELVSPSGKAISLKTAVESPYALASVIPDDTPSGKYLLRLWSVSENSGSASAPREIEIHPLKSVALRTVSVTDFGAVGDGKFDNSGAFAAALTRAATLGGAEVRIPAGAFLLSKPIEIPVGVYLAGESTEATALAFTDVGIAPDVWIKGSQYFGLRDLTVYCGNHKTIISSDMTGNPDKAGHVRIRNIRVVGSLLRGHNPKPDEVGRRVALLVQYASVGFETLRLSGPDIAVEDSYLFGSGRSLYVFRATGVVVRRNKLFNGILGWYDFDCSENIISENNLIQGGDLSASGGAYSAYGSPRRSANIYTANNSYSNFLGGDREAITDDGPDGAYHGAVVKVEGRHLTLKDPANWGKSDWHGAAAIIMDGHGSGQWRTIRDWSDAGVELSDPFDIAPDTTSILTVVPMHVHYIFFRNHFEETGVAIQFYGTSIEHIVAENDETHAGGYYVFAKTYHGGVQPVLNVQLLENQVHSGLSYHYGSNGEYFAGSSLIDVRSLEGSSITGLVLRNNILTEQGAIHIKRIAPSRMTGILLEGNKVSDPAHDVQIDKSVGAEIIVR